ncbi:hypothetical protein [Vibrio phage vB_VaM_H2]|nr:hypothetical protein [Vibrio phage vB_VaM_H2]
MATRLIQTERIPMSIPKKKRAQLIRLQQQKVRRQLNNYYLAWDPLSMEYVTPFDAQGNKGVMTQGFVDALKYIEVKWRIHCYILGREHNGKERIDGFTLDINTPCKHDDIKNVAADAHWEFIEEYRNSPRSDNFVSAVWIATTRDEVDNELAYKIFKEAGSFNLLADWQEKELENE